MVCAPFQGGVEVHTAPCSWPLRPRREPVPGRTTLFLLPGRAVREVARRRPFRSCRRTSSTAAGRPSGGLWSSAGRGNRLLRRSRWTAERRGCVPGTSSQTGLGPPGTTLLCQAMQEAGVPPSFRDPTPGGPSVAGLRSRAWGCVLITSPPGQGLRRGPPGAFGGALWAGPASSTLLSSKDHFLQLQGPSGPAPRPSLRLRPPCRPRACGPPTAPESGYNHDDHFISHTGSQRYTEPAESGNSLHLLPFMQA